MYEFCSNNVFYWERLSFRMFLFLLTAFWYFGFLLRWIKSQPGVVYKSVAYNKSCNLVLQSFKHEKMTLPHGFIFVFILYFIGAVLPKKCYQKCGLQKKIKRRGWLYRRGIVYRRGLNFLYTITMFYVYNRNYKLWLLCF